MYKIFKLNDIITKKKPGVLIDINLNKIKEKLNFNLKKIFYIKDLNSELSRGNHSNSNVSEVLICMKGSFELKLFDGKKYDTFNMKENDCIFVPENIWIEFKNFKNCIIMVLVDILDKKEKKSIYDINEFIEYVNNKKK